ncbi:hypothetical protein BGZ97_008939 [Linnemannia gamsii]|jgi:hypothetical protein|uniref:Extracellular membrane protein CFEM domain-containing protein n=1 Tax=Linnemannia gamsii TaxID=64522 RepID=A0A9P6UE81_9FUNG|nr:hypothetical protein BGZ97_008939 [Linnemannia gamsii]
MKIQFLTIAALALATSTVSAFSCPRDPIETIETACLSNLLDAALCNCNAFANIASGNCWDKCDIASSQYKQVCQNGCVNRLGKDTDACRRKYDNYKNNGGGIEWAAQMQVKKGGWC